MQTQMYFTMKSAMISVIMLAIILFCSCGREKGRSVNDSIRSQSSETRAEPPALDLHTAVFMDDLKTVEQHVRAGTDLDLKDEYGSTPLMIAVTFNRMEAARALIEGDANVNCTNNDGSTPLHTAAFLGRTEMVRFLLDNGADKDIRNNFGSTALESVQVPFDNVIDIYDQFSRDLGPLGLKLDYNRIRMSRPVIAEMLQ